jgi:signal transduction histidine kinase
VHTRKDGRTLVVASHWALHRDTEGGPVAVLEVNNDVTELEKLQEALRDADRRKDEFLATLAHELRNPLAPLRNALHTMRLARNDLVLIEEARQLMERQLKQLVRLIDDLLDLSRISRGKIQLRRERVQLQDTIDVALETSRPHLQAAGHQVTVTVPDRPLYVAGDATRLAQVVSNLLNNAAKYTPVEGSVALQVEAVDGEVVLRVRDTGLGIPAEMLPRIFDMFTQVDRSLERSQGGLGIGLSLVRGLVELHGGSVAALSAGPGQGSEFQVRLPLLPVGEPEDVREAPTAEAGGTAAPPRQTRRVLVVEDHPDGARSLATLLEVLGHEVRTVFDGRGAVAEARTYLPEVVLLDIGLPGLNGYEVARQLRREPALEGVFLIAMTGWGQPEDRRRSYEAGFNAHLVKPVELHDLEPLLVSLGV